jgi:hypothetical protein
MFTSVTDEMRQQLCDYLQGLWDAAVAERYAMAPRSAVPLLDDILLAHANAVQPDRAPSQEHGRAQAPSVLSRARRQSPQTWRARERA